MFNDSSGPDESTAVDDVRRVRQRIDRESAGDLRRHVEETNLIFETLRTTLNIKIAAPTTQPPISKTGGH